MSDAFFARLALELATGAGSVKDKRNAMHASWIPGGNRLGTHGRWAFAEFADVWEIESGLATAIGEAVAKLLAAAGGGSG
jgi:type III restriction enzyme